MTEERLIDGVLHVLEGKTFRPLSAEELTARLLEARRMLDVRPAPVYVPLPQTYPVRYPWDYPVWSRDPTSADAPIPGITITSGACLQGGSDTVTQ